MHYLLFFKLFSYIISCGKFSNCTFLFQKNNQFYAYRTPEELAAIKQCAVEGSAKAQPTSIAVSAAMMLAIKFGYIKTHGPLQSSIYVVFSGMMTYFTSRLVYGASCINNLPPIKAKFQGRFNAVNEQQQKQGPR